MHAKKACTAPPESVLRARSVAHRALATHARCSGYNVCVMRYTQTLYPDASVYRSSLARDSAPPCAHNVTPTGPWHRQGVGYHPATLGALPAQASITVGTCRMQCVAAAPAAAAPGPPAYVCLVGVVFCGKGDGCEVFPFEAAQCLGGGLLVKSAPTRGGTTSLGASHSSQALGGA